ncbi:Hachiman antiphage defense system protein HamA [Mucilaginibacter phyllosphaerae]|uniref:DUF1837 domain-containing protein n=1 Tax=Mucilaginibacter phyllosphaerae TaxID=1812349 RepID=A0A4Y8A7F4_9SPHI|nr:Hachiman antiphage defense system protein HamA [Mucilaginibacter phyllosphaerae]MBB3969529.1 hypothetical protein [Mucilaginibacter phyllosphaerae]TEW63626.1 DUF1837 domain-containing protein [Mucilaginibacter phyllosphaerae]GGH23842.1 hypothetical protein GCM10007352_37970 [Mucilaginibacter phyllosphaerae]
MPWSGEHTKWFKQRTSALKTADGSDVTVLDFKPDLKDAKAMSAWAKHFRNHYVFDTEIDALRQGTSLSRTAYINQLKFPTTDPGLGPGIRSGDFGEILVADFLEYHLLHWVPRTRYGIKTIRDESSKGSDLIGFKLFDKKQSPKDILTIIEAKAQFSGKKAKPRLQDAIDGSAKDAARLGESLNAIKQRLYDKGYTDECAVVERYQDPVSKPYKTQYGAAALFCNAAYEDTAITTATGVGHPYKKDLFLVLIRADDFMDLVHHLYELAANEA